VLTLHVTYLYRTKHNLYFWHKMYTKKLNVTYVYKETAFIDSRKIHEAMDGIRRT